MSTEFLRTMVLDRDRSRCVYCGRIMTAGQLTVVHETPLARGGEDVLDNLQSACRECAVDKGDRTAQEYFSFVRWRERLLHTLANQ